MRLRALPIAILLIATLPPADGLAARKRRTAPPRPATGRPSPSPVRPNTFWAGSDGKGSILLFWLPAQGEWPRGGFRLERVVRGKRTAIVDALRPGSDARAMASLAPEDADAIRGLAAKIDAGTLTDEDRRLSISVMGRNAAVDTVYGRALGVRHTDGPRATGTRSYRLLFLDAAGAPTSELSSGEVDPGRRTPGPEKPPGLGAVARAEGVALTWPDPPASAVAPVVAFSVERLSPERRTSLLTPRPLVINRHVATGEPDFLDADPPRRAATYHVRSHDVFGRRSVPAQAAVTADELAQARAAPRTADAGGSGDRAADAGFVAPPPPLPREKSVTEEFPATPAPPPATAPRADIALFAAVAAQTAGPLPPPTPPPAAAAKADVAPSPQPTPPAAAPAASAKAEAGPAPRPAIEPPAAVSPAPADARPANPGPILRRSRNDADEGSGAEIWARMAAGRGVSASPTPEAAPSARPGRAAPDAQGAEPPAPTITGIAAANGKVTISFRPGAPDDLTKELIVLRSESPFGEGVPVGRPIAAEARQWEDATVARGRNYWYRLVALGRNGARSDAAGPRWIRVGD